MPEIIELLPEAPGLAHPFFEDEQEYNLFRERFIQMVTPELERWQEARRKSEEESRQRLLR